MHGKDIQQYRVETVFKNYDRGMKSGNTIPKKVSLHVSLPFKWKQTETEKNRDGDLSQEERC